MPTLVLGEALVDLVCPHPVASFSEADAFEPHSGGSMANAAVGAARRGASLAFAGGAGDDPWGRWLRERLTAEGLDLAHFGLVPGASTGLAFVTVDDDGEPTYAFATASGPDPLPIAAGDRIRDAVAAADALVFGSDTLDSDDERVVTLAAREHALDLGRPIVFDPNLRPERWERPEQALEEARDCIRGAFLVKCNQAEARQLTGEDDPARAAAGLVAGGAKHVVITLGADGAILRGGGLEADAPGVEAKPVSATGAGDAVTAALVARLHASRYYPPALAAALPEAVEAGARATESLGALG